MNRLAIAVVVGIVLLGGGIAAWSHYETVVEERATLELERNGFRAMAADAAETIGEMAHDNKVLDELLATRERERGARAQELEKARDEINELRNSQDADVARWANERMPGAAVERLCRHAPGACRVAEAPAGASAGRAHAADAGAGAGEGPDERGPRAARDRRALGAPAVQR